MSRVVALSGGIGGAKLALGLSHVLAPDDLTLVVNTGDDFVHLGLHISPDIDTALYTLAGLAHPQLGWGRADEGWAAMETLAQLGGPDWFRLGDRDLALHLVRTQALADGHTLSEVTAQLAEHLGVRVRVCPMSDDPVPTQVRTDEGVLDFQRYFVARRCEPQVQGLDYAGAAQARCPQAVLDALADPALETVVVCPSNPWLSLGPMLAIPALRAALQACPAPVVAVSPLVGGQAVKGPTAKIMQELGLPVSAAAVASFYGDLIDGYLLDERDAAVAPNMPVPVRLADTLMTDLDDRIRVARAALTWARELRAGR